MKNLMKVLTSAAIIATTASADMGRIEVGIGSWSQTPSGERSYTESLTGAVGNDVSQEIEDSSAYLWMLIKHPIPIIPNFRLEYASLKDSGLADGAFKNFTAPVNTKTTLTMNQYDVIPYYNILDNTAWITLDLGIDLKVIETSYEAEGVVMPVFGATLTNYSDSDSVVIPLVYVRTRVEIPATNIGLEADLKYVTYDSSTIYDTRIKVDYTLDFVPVIQPAIEVGYRMQKIDLSDDSAGDVKINLDYSGVYVGIFFRY